MNQLPQDKYEKVRSFFHGSYPNLPFIYGIIDHLLPGQIWVDNENKPNNCLVMTGAAYCFMAGKLSEGEFRGYFDLLKEKEKVELAIESDSQLELSKFGFVPTARRQYRYNDIQSTIPYYENDTNYILKKIEDEKIFNLCMWKSLVVNIFGNAENYLKNGMGFILWDSQKQLIASEAHGVPSKELVEIGAITHEDYRGKKLSTILCNHLIHYVIKKRLQPVWSCDEANVISLKLAEKQGMDDLMKYTFHILNKSLNKPQN